MLITALTLSGCSAAESAPSAAPPAGAAEIAQDPSVTSTPAPTGCTYIGEGYVNPDLLSSLDGTVQVALPDLGPRDHAEGTVTLDGNGNAAAYKIAEGDHLDDILARFCVDRLWLEYLNHVRGFPFSSGGIPVLYTDDVLNLSPYTITSVGDYHGVVQHNEPVTQYGPLPPQH